MKGFGQTKTKREAHADVAMPDKEEKLDTKPDQKGSVKEEAEGKTAQLSGLQLMVRLCTESSRRSWRHTWRTGCSRTCTSGRRG